MGEDWQGRSLIATSTWVKVTDVPGPPGDAVIETFMGKVVGHRGREGGCRLVDLSSHPDLYFGRPGTGYQM
jgi:hypothetical protein